MGPSLDISAEYDIYLSGPMTGLPDSNFPAFNEAAKRLRSFGHKVFNPAETGEIEGWSHQDYMKFDLPIVARSEGMVLLPGWSSSEGVQHELVVAKACGLWVGTYAETSEDRWGYRITVVDEGPSWWPNPPEAEVPAEPEAQPEETILQEAQRLVFPGGDRNSVYGPPLDDWGTNGIIFSAWLTHWLQHHHPDVLNKPLPAIPGDLACVLAIGLKATRLMISPSRRDSWTDICGYAACGHWAHQDAAERKSAGVPFRHQMPQNTAA